MIQSTPWGFPCAFRGRAIQPDLLPLLHFGSNSYRGPQTDR
jgi:hypothetical protein